MSKPKINLEELSKDMDEIFKMLKEFDENSPSNLDMDTFNKKAEYIKQKLEKKYKNLDTPK